jgi:hypothetical protein
MNERPAMAVIYLGVTIEENEEDGQLPSADVAASHIGDILNDVTKHDTELPWRVTGVAKVDIPGASE